MAVGRGARRDEVGRGRGIQQPEGVHLCIACLKRCESAGNHVIPFTFPADCMQYSVGVGARESRASRRRLINLWLDPDVYAPGTVNHPMYE